MKIFPRQKKILFSFTKSKTCNPPLYTLSFLYKETPHFFKTFGFLSPFGTKCTIYPLIIIPLDGFKFYLYVGLEIWRGLLWQTDNNKFLEPPNSAKWNGYFTGIIKRNTNAIEKEYFRSVYCNRNVIDYIYFDPVIMITFWLHLDYFSSFWLILS
jgi:hypothetical protein